LTLLIGTGLGLSIPKRGEKPLIPTKTETNYFINPQKYKLPGITTKRYPNVKQEEVIELRHNKAPFGNLRNISLTI
jgi:hypothetical protein